MTGPTNSWSRSVKSWSPVRGESSSLRPSSISVGRQRTTGHDRRPLTGDDGEMATPTSQSRQTNTVTTTASDSQHSQ